jgi:hypothetical protein
MSPGKQPLPTEMLTYLDEFTLLDTIKTEGGFELNGEYYLTRLTDGATELTIDKYSKEWVFLSVFASDFERGLTGITTDGNRVYAASKFEESTKNSTIAYETNGVQVYDTISDSSSTAYSLLFNNLQLKQFRSGTHYSYRTVDGTYISGSGEATGTYSGTGTTSQATSYGFDSNSNTIYKLDVDLKPTAETQSLSAEISGGSAWGFMINIDDVLHLSVDNKIIRYQVNDNYKP